MPKVQENPAERRATKAVTHPAPPNNASKYRRQSRMRDHLTIPLLLNHPHMLRVAITLEGRTIEDIDKALDEARRQVLNGDRSGSNASESGAFKFQVTGQEET